MVEYIVLSFGEYPMKMPATSAAQLLFMSPGARFVAWNQFAYPALQVQSVLDRISGNGIIQNTSANQPIWAGGSLIGTYSLNNPSSTGASTGSAGLSFNGTTQYLEYDALAASVAGPSNSFTMVSVVSCTASATASTIWSFADATDGYSVSLSYQSGSLNLKDVNVHGTFTATATLDNNIHIVSCVKTPTNLIIRVDGTQVASVANTGGTGAYTTFVLGALNSNGTVGSYFTGKMGTVAAYLGNADIIPVENFLLQGYGLIAGLSQGFQSGGF